MFLWRALKTKYIVAALIAKKAPLPPKPKPKPAPRVSAAAKPAQT